MIDGDALDKLVARANETIGSHESAPMARLVHQLADAITQLRQRVAAAEQKTQEVAQADQKEYDEAIDKLESALAERDRRIAETLEYCEDREDIIDGEFGPRPNDFMQIATILKGRQA